MLLRIQHRSSEPVYRQIARQIKELIFQARLGPGDRVETVRALSIELRLNPSTVAKAYQMLAEDGTFEVRSVTGTFVAPSAPEKIRHAELIRYRELVEATAVAAASLGIDADGIHAEVTRLHKRGSKPRKAAGRRGRKPS